MINYTENSTTPHPNILCAIIMGWYTGRQDNGKEGERKKEVSREKGRNYQNKIGRKYQRKKGRINVVNAAVFFTAVCCNSIFCQMAALLLA